MSTPQARLSLVTLGVIAALSAQAALAQLEGLGGPSGAVSAAPDSNNSPPEGAPPLDRLLVSNVPEGSSPRVQIKDPYSGEILHDILVFDEGFTGGVNVTQGDWNGDGTPDLIAGAGPGGSPVVKVFDGKTGSEVHSFLAYPSGFTGGVHVSAADMNGDGRADIATGAGRGGAPHVRVFNSVDDSFLYNAFPLGTSGSGGAQVSLADMNGDGTPDIVTAAGPGSSPRVRVMDGKTGSAIHDFMAFNRGFAGGVTLATGDVDGDGKADIITGAGQGGTAHVRAFSGDDLSRVSNFFALGTSYLGGISVGAEDVDGDGKAEIITERLDGRGRDQEMIFTADGQAIDRPAFGTLKRPTPGAPGSTQTLAQAPVEEETETPAEQQAARPASNKTMIVKGAESGSAPWVEIEDPETGQNLRFLAFPEGFRGGVNVTQSDVNGDGTPDLVAAAGPGGGPHVRVFDGKTGDRLLNFFAYNTAFTGGVNVAGGDIDGDGIGDIVTGVGPGGGPHMKIFSGKDGSVIDNRFPFDSNLRDGISVAVEDTDGDGNLDVIASAPGQGDTILTGAELFGLSPRTPTDTPPPSTTLAQSPPADEFGEDGFDSDGFDRDGFNADGVNRDGFDRNGIHVASGNTSNTDGLNAAQAEALSSIENNLQMNDTLRENLVKGLKGDLSSINATDLIQLHSALFELPLGGDLDNNENRSVFARMVNSADDDTAVEMLRLFEQFRSRAYASNDDGTRQQIIDFAANTVRDTETGQMVPASVPPLAFKPDSPVPTQLTAFNQRAGNNAQSSAAQDPAPDASTLSVQAQTQAYERFIKNQSTGTQETAALATLQRLQQSQGINDDNTPASDAIETLAATSSAATSFTHEGWIGMRSTETGNFGPMTASYMRKIGSNPGTAADPEFFLQADFPTAGNTYTSTNPLTLGDSLANTLGAFSQISLKRWAAGGNFTQNGPFAADHAVAANEGVWALGVVTPAGEMPSTGAAVYTGETVGTDHRGQATAGTANITANFAVNKLDATLTTSHSLLQAGQSMSATFSELDISGNSYNGVNGNNQINGSFFGTGANAAAETGGAWIISTPSGTIHASGAFRAQQ